MYVRIIKIEVKFTPSYRCKTTPFGTRVKSTPYGTRVKITHPVGGGGGGGVKITLFGGGSKLLSKPGGIDLAYILPHFLE